MAPSPSLPPPPSRPVSATGNDVLDAIRAVGRVPAGSPREQYAQGLIDLQRITFTAYEELCRLAAVVQPGGVRHVLISYDELEKIMDPLSRNAIRALINNGRILAQDHPLRGPGRRRTPAVPKEPQE